MSFTVSNTQIEGAKSYQPAFRGKWEKTESGNPYYKTSTGAVAGGIMAIPAALSWIDKLTLPVTEEEVKKRVDKIKDNILKHLDKDMKAPFSESFDEGLKQEKDNILKQIEKNKKIKKLAVPFAVIAAGLTAGCGVLVDYLRNKKAKEIADSVREKGVKAAVMQNDRVQISNKGRAYYESNQGSKYGVLLGAACGVAHSAMNGLKKPGAYITGVLMFGLGGWIMGKIADSNANKDARKHA